MENIKTKNDALKTNLHGSYRLYQRAGQDNDSMNREILKDNSMAALETRQGIYDGTCWTVETEESVVLRPSKSLGETYIAQKLKTKRPEIDWQLQNAWAIASGQQLQKKFCKWTTEGQLTNKDEYDRFSSFLEDDPTSQLKAQLAVSIAMGQELLKRLDGKKQEDEFTVKHDLQFKEFTDSSQSADLNILVCKLKEENRELKRRIASKYELGREDYAQGLCKRLKESNPLAGLRVGVEAGVEPEPINRTLLQWEIERLNRLLDEKMKDCAELTQEWEDSRKLDQDRIQTLELQALIYKEDFKAERADREKAQSKIHDLQEEVRRLQRKLKQQARERRDSPATHWVHIGHGMSAHMRVDAAQPLMANADQPGSQRSSRQLATARTKRQALNDLQCPLCLISYDNDHTADYLKHCEDCSADL